MKKNEWLFFIPILLVYLAGMFIDVLEPDAAQYAIMSLDLLNSNNYLELYYRGQDYIDKPPLLFWCTALSFKLFGVSNFTYKLPSVLFSLLGLWATYELGKLLCNRRIGFYSALILASCQAWFMTNQDVRTDNILAACTIVAIWQLVLFNRTNNFTHVLYAALGIAGAMLTKGPIGLMVPALAMANDFGLKRAWRKFFKLEWLALIFIVLIFLLPMLWGLYTQFDSTFGKQTYNGFITSGIRFYFWTQSFGRLTGESVWKNNHDVFFFVHTSLWAFLPWSFIFIAAFVKKIRAIVTTRLKIDEADEGVTIGGILFPFIAFSLSQYKLPHYIFVVFPLMAILSGWYIHQWINESVASKNKILNVLQMVVNIVLLLLVGTLCTICFPSAPYIYTLPIMGLIIVCLLATKAQSTFYKIVFPSFLSIVLANLLLNIHVYPRLLLYQAETRAGQHAKMLSDDLPFIGFDIESFSLDFYYRKEVPRINTVSELTKRYQGQSLWVYTHEKGLKELEQKGIEIIQQQTLDDYHVSKLTVKFLNPQRREKVVDHKYLLKIRV